MSESSQKTSDAEVREDKLNPDPITGEPGSHPVGTSLGAAGAGAAELVNPTIEDSYWRKRHVTEPYYDPDHTFEDYAPAYRAGYMRYEPSRTFEETEPELIGHYQTHRGTSRLEWEKARPASHAAWKRRHEAFTLANSNVSGRLLS